MKVWYTSYGSNLFEDRFLTYIKGGKIEGMKYGELGCRNKALPTKKDTYLLKANYKFLEHASKWDNLGVAFVSLKEPLESEIIVTSYLIEAEQFIDVMLQENSIDPKKETFGIELLDKTTKEVFPGRWYSTIIYLGEKDGYDSYTFTCDEDRFLKERVTPSLSYLSVIMNGAYSSGKYSKQEVVNHYYKSEEVKKTYSIETLLDLIR